MITGFGRLAEESTGRCGPQPSLRLLLLQGASTAEGGGTHPAEQAAAPCAEGTDGSAPHEHCQGAG